MAGCGAVAPVVPPPSLPQAFSAAHQRMSTIAGAPALSMQHAPGSPGAGASLSSSGGMKPFFFFFCFCFGLASCFWFLGRLLLTPDLCVAQIRAKFAQMQHHRWQLPPQRRARRWLVRRRRRRRRRRREATLTSTINNSSSRDNRHSSTRATRLDWARPCRRLRWCYKRASGVPPWPPRRPARPARRPPPRPLSHMPRGRAAG